MPFLHQHSLRNNEAKTLQIGGGSVKHIGSDKREYASYPKVCNRLFDFFYSFSVVLFFFLLIYMSIEFLYFLKSSNYIRMVHMLFSCEFQ